MALKSVQWSFVVPPKKDVTRAGGKLIISPGFPLTVKNGDDYITTVWTLCAAMGGELLEFEYLPDL